MSQFLKNKSVLFISLMVVVTTITYLNHFDNAFHFDDFHTITGNPNIRSLKNIPSFFKDGSTISSLPQNQTYRPIVTLSLAIDYWMGNGYNLFYFHFSSFIIFLILGVLLFFLTQKILNLSLDSTYSFYVASGITLFYMLHPVMAETINYIIARSDLQSTFFVVLAFVIYQYSKLGKQYYLYLIPIVIGTLSKPTTIMFGPLFFCYIALFEEEISLPSFFSFKSFTPLSKVIQKTWITLVVCVLLFVFHQAMTPDTFTTGSSKTYNYLITQPYVILYYFRSIFLPTHLSADTDWSVLPSIWSYKFLLGILFIATMTYIIWICSKTKKLYPIAFGILWFFIALAPTSSFIPLAEVMNDHRMFLPYIGLVISTGYSFWLLVSYFTQKYQLASHYYIPAIAILLLLYGFGTFQRNTVWDTEESLWEDVTIKSPKNGRGHMNYGLTQMSKGEYENAEKHFLKALNLTPKYHYLHINLGILNNAKGNKKIAEDYFKKAINYGSNYHNSWFYYGRFLTNTSRYNDAVKNLSKALNLFPSHLETRNLLMKNYLALEKWDMLEEIATKTLEIDSNNTNAKSYLEASIKKEGKLATEESKLNSNPTAIGYYKLSFKYYKNKEYQRAIKTAEKAIELKPNYPEAYNNICSAYNVLGEYDKAIQACEKAIELSPNFQRAKNNLKDVHNKNSRILSLINQLEKDASERNYLSISLLYYKYGLFKRSAEIAVEGIKKYPNSVSLYNNACAAYNAIKQWDKGIEYGKLGLKIDPNNKLLKNNYNWAIKNENK